MVDGKPLFAIEEERLIREKRTRKFPFQGIKETLNKNKLTLEDLDCIAVGWNPAINLEKFNSAFQEKNPDLLVNIFIVLLIV